MDIYFYEGYEDAKNSLRYATLSNADLFKLAGCYFREYAKDKDTYAFGQCKGINEILANRILKGRVA